MREVCKYQSIIQAQQDKQSEYYNLNLPPELGNELSDEASQLNLTLSEYILRVLTVRQVIANPPKTGAELVAYWQSEGVINSRPGITDGQAYARRLRHEAETRERTQVKFMYLLLNVKHYRVIPGLLMEQPYTR